MRDKLTRFRVVLLFILIGCEGLCLTLHGQNEAPASPFRWYKGNTHTHTTNSDGDSPPDKVVRWYREHGYDFLFITDHQLVTEVGPLNSQFGSDGKFLVLKGEEVTARFSKLPVHLNALEPNQTVVKAEGVSLRETLQKNIDVITQSNGLAQINHPNYGWALTADDIASVKGALLLEIMNMHPGVNGAGAGSELPSAEEIWDRVLSKGVVMWGVASDDMHSLNGKQGLDYQRETRPGRAWIMVRARQLTPRDIIDAIKRGDFYASTGVTLKDYQAIGKQIEVKIEPTVRWSVKYRIQFIGKNGKLLQETVGESAIHKIKGKEGYVRARIVDSNGKMAWTQPILAIKTQKSR